ncbi:unnamed protein product [Danaus chrysippus]|uniref:(African queen) hypothetical protein n=1 Tax=Danaus chrysippus TaxID=151541 RepID=A0A8J2R4I7_9NEOP|nr:unnamed protein product [Danaus chrysippus]
MCRDRDTLGSPHTSSIRNARYITRKNHGQNRYIQIDIVLCLRDLVGLKLGIVSVIVSGCGVSVVGLGVSTCRSRVRLAARRHSDWTRSHRVLGAHAKRAHDIRSPRYIYIQCITTPYIP